VQEVRPSYLRVIFPKLGFFINDPRVRITVNGLRRPSRASCRASIG